jgi:prepilin-type N-terminal cleavage/methylation domain-containing protein/prepilin-type processing-associated H-X9-DG protein
MCCRRKCSSTRYSPQLRKKIDTNHSARRQLPFAIAAGFRYKARMKPVSRNQNAPKGFSLIELLITLALIIILTTMMFGFSSARHQRNQKELCADNLQKIFLALQIYANDFGGALPQNTNAQTSEPVLDALVPKYTVDTSIFICPGGRDSQIPSGESLAKHKISYAYYMGCRLTNAQEVLLSDRQVDTQPKRTGEIIFSPNGKSPGNNHHKYGGNFLFGDGSVQSSPPELAFPLAFTPGAVLLNPKP